MIASTLLLSALLTLSAVPEGVGRTVDWARLEAAVRQYMLSPSDRSAAVVRGLLPQGGRARFGVPEERAASEEFYQALEHSLPTIGRLIEGRNREAVRLAFDLRSACDGALLEDLDAVLTRLVRVDPTLFLSEVRAHGGKAAIDVAAFTGAAFVDQEEAKCAELNQRIRALESVHDDSLAALRDLAIEKIRKATTPIPRCK